MTYRRAEIIGPLWQRLADAETAVTDCATCGRALDVWALRGGGCQQCSASTATPPVDATPPTGRTPSRPVGGISAAPTHAVDAPVRGDGADPPAVPVTPTGDDERSRG